MGKRVGIDGMMRKIDLLFWTRNDIRSMKRGTGLRRVVSSRGTPGAGSSGLG